MAVTEDMKRSATEKSMDDAANADMENVLTHDPLPLELRIKAERELDEKPERLEEDLKRLWHLIKGDKNLVTPSNGKFLVKFLRARKFNVENSFTLLQQYYKLRAHNPELFRDLRPSVILESFHDNLQGFLAGKDKEQRGIFVFRGGAWDPTKVSPEDIFRANLMCLELALQDPANQIHGIVALVDMEGFGFNHIRHASPSYMRKVISLVQDCFPARFQAIHIVRESSLIDITLAIIRPFLKKKLKGRIHLYGYNMERLHHHISPQTLPKEYGGHQEVFSNEAWVRQLMDNEELFVKNMKYGYNHKGKLQQSGVA